MSEEDCKPGLLYCGWKLIRTGNYYPRIATEIREQNLAVDEEHVNHVLFQCLSHGKGIIEFGEFCGNNKCQDGGPNDDDFCATPSSEVQRSSSSKVPSATSSPSTLSTIATVPTSPSPSSQSSPQNPTPTPTNPSATPPPPFSTNASNTPQQAISQNNYVAMAVGIGVGVTVLIIGMFTFAIILTKRRRARNITETTESRGHTPTTPRQGLRGVGVETRITSGGGLEGFVRKEEKEDTVREKVRLGLGW